MLLVRYVQSRLIAAGRRHIIVRPATIHLTADSWILQAECWRWRRPIDQRSSISRTIFERRMGFDVVFMPFA
jgi:hypothetical protein